MPSDRDPRALSCDRSVFSHASQVQPASGDAVIRVEAARAVRRLDRGGLLGVIGTRSPARLRTRARCPTFGSGRPRTRSHRAPLPERPERRRATRIGGRRWHSPDALERLVGPVRACERDRTDRPFDRRDPADGRPIRHRVRSPACDRVRLFRVVRLVCRRPASRRPRRCALSPARVPRAGQPHSRPRLNGPPVETPAPPPANTGNPLSTGRPSGFGLEGDPCRDR